MLLTIYSFVSPFYFVPIPSYDMPTYQLSMVVPCPSHVIVDGNRVRKYTAATGMVSTLAGGDNAEFADGKGHEARFHTPNGLVADGVGNVYVCDTNNHRIRKISPDGRNMITPCCSVVIVVGRYT
jgi:hypothetical protein